MSQLVDMLVYDISALFFLSILYTISLCKRLWYQLYSKGFVWNFEIFLVYEYSAQRGIEYQQAVLCRKCMPSIITAIPPPIGHATMKFGMNDSNEMSNFFLWEIHHIGGYSY